MKIAKLTLMFVTVWIAQSLYGMDAALDKLGSSTGTDLAAAYVAVEEALKGSCTSAQLKSLAEKLGESADEYDLENKQERANFVNFLQPLVERKKDECTVASSSSSVASRSSSSSGSELVALVRSQVAGRSKKYQELQRAKRLLQAKCIELQRGWTDETKRARSLRDEKDSLYKENETLRQGIEEIVSSEPKE